jgi:flagellar hook-basal body complex protein FliE
LPIAAGDRYGTSRIALTSYFQDAFADTDRPAWVYIHAAESDSEELEKVEKKIFGKEDLSMATNYFDCYRIEASELSTEDRSILAKRLPAFVLVGTDGRVLAQHKGSSHPDSLLSFLVKGYKAVYGVSLPPKLDLFEDVLKRMENAEDKVAQASQKVKDLATTADMEKPRDQEKVQEAQQAFEEAKAALALMREERNKLLEVPSKS